jgi:hypothetical protein
VIFVSRNGVVQSELNGDYFRLDDVITFSDPFVADEDVIVCWSPIVTAPGIPAHEEFSPYTSYRQRDHEPRGAAVQQRVTERDCAARRSPQRPHNRLHSVWQQPGVQHTIRRRRACRGGVLYPTPHVRPPRPLRDLTHSWSYSSDATQGSCLCADRSPQRGHRGYHRGTLHIRPATT